MSLSLSFSLKAERVLNGINTVSQIMNRNVATLDASRTLMDAVQIMTERSVGCAIATSDRKAVEILTERDVMKAMLSNNDILGNNVTQVMSIPLTTISPDTSVVEALDLMKKKAIRRLPVVSNGELQGIIKIHTNLLYWTLAAAKMNSLATKT